MELTKVKEPDYIVGGNHEYFIDKNKRKQGSFKDFYKNGNLYSFKNFINDNENGLKKLYFSDQSFGRIESMKKNERFGIRVDFQY